MKTIYNEGYVRLIKAFRQRRIKLGLRQADVAVKMGVHRAIISKTELHERRLDLLETFKLGQVLGMTLQQIQKILKQGMGTR